MGRKESIRPGQTLSAYALSKKQAGLGAPQQLLASITCPPGPDTRQEVTTERCPVIVKKIKSVKQLRRALHFSLCSRKVPEYRSCLLRSSNGINTSVSGQSRAEKLSRQSGTQCLCGTETRKKNILTLALL